MTEREIISAFILNNEELCLWPASSSRAIVLQCFVLPA